MIQRDGCRSLVMYRYGMSGRRMAIPCGRCIGCRLERSRQWAIRATHEMRMHQDNCFVTLTYRDEDLVYGDSRPTLYPRHLQLFWKRLRKETNGGIRYFACGEYGDKLLRPHYHAIIFGLDFEDKYYHKDSNGSPLYISPLLDRVWTHGDCYVGSASFESAAYIARYICTKKLGDQSDYYDRERIMPEFATMSKKPGLGSSWFERYGAQVYPRDSVLARGVESSAPRFYLSKLRRCNPLQYEQVVYARAQRAEQMIDDPENQGNRLAVRRRVNERRRQMRSGI